MPFSSESAARHGAKGGRKRSAAKRAHARVNGVKGGRPVKPLPTPAGLKPPEGASAQEARAHAHKFAEYYAKLAVKMNAFVEPLFTDEEILATLRRLKRYDLVTLRKQQLARRSPSALRYMRATARRLTEKRRRFDEYCANCGCPKLRSRPDDEECFVCHTPWPL